jgi:hypothetical protein
MTTKTRREHRIAAARRRPRGLGPASGSNVACRAHVAGVRGSPADLDRVGRFYRAPVQ